MKNLLPFVCLILSFLGASAQPIAYKIGGGIQAYTDDANFWYFLEGSSDGQILKIAKADLKENRIKLNSSWPSNALGLKEGILYFSYNLSLKGYQLFYFTLNGNIVNTGILHSSGNSFQDAIRPIIRDGRVFIVGFDKEWKLYEFFPNTGTHKFLFSTSSDPTDVFTIGGFPAMSVRNRSKLGFEYWLIDSLNTRILYESIYGNTTYFYAATVVATTRNEAYILPIFDKGKRHLRPLLRLTLTGVDSVGVFPFGLSRESFVANKIGEPMPEVVENKVLLNVYDNYGGLEFVSLNLMNHRWNQFSIVTLDTLSISYSSYLGSSFLGKNRWLINSKISGLELYHQRGDSLFQVADFWNGPSDGLERWSKIEGSWFVNDTCYFISSKGTNGKWYLSYQASPEDSIKQLFAVPASRGVDRWDTESIYATSSGCFIEHSYSLDAKGLALVFYPLNAPKEVQAAVPEVKQGEWVRHMGEISSNVNGERIGLNHAIVTGNNESIIAIEKNLLTPLMDYDNKIVYAEKGTNTIIKLDSNGNSVWWYTHSNRARSGNNKLASTSNGDVLVAGCGWQGAIIGGDSLEKGSVNYLMKLDGKTGKPIWTEWFFQKLGFGSPEEIEAMVCDKQDNIYIMFNMETTNFGLDNISFVLSRPSAHVLVKFSPVGTVLWASELPINFDRSWTGNTVQLLVDEQHGQIISLTTQAAFYNSSSTCAFTSWDVLYSSVALDSGKLRWKKELEFSDLGGMLNMAFNSKGFLVSNGYYRGAFSADGFRFITPRVGSECNQVRSLQLLMNPLDGSIQFAQWHPTSTFLPFRASAHGNQVWQLGVFPSANDRGNRYDWLLTANDFNGRHLLDVPMVKRSDPFDWEVNAFIHCSNGYAFIADYSSRQMGVFFTNYNNHSAVSVFKLKLPEVSTYSDYYDAKALERKLLFGPNPIAQTLELGYPEPGAYNKIEVFELSGKLVSTRLLQTQVIYESLDFTDLLPGLYLFRFSGSAGTFTSRMVKE